MKDQGRLILGVVLAALAVTLLWFHATFEFVKTPTTLGYRGQALSNKYLAAQRLIQRMGHPATCLRGLPDPLPPTGDTLVLPVRHLAMTRAQAEALANWVDQGGYLLAEGLDPEAPEAPETLDPLFRAFGLRLNQVQEPSSQDGIMECVVDQVDMKVRTRRGLKLQVTGKAPDSAAGTEDGLQIAQFNHGQGCCYLVTNLDCLSNGSLGELDHAAFLCALTLRGEEAGASRVWLVAWEEPSAPWAWLRGHAGPFLVSLALLVATLLWAAAPRFGPLKAAPEAGRRRFLEHLDASGRYHWRQSGGTPLIKASRAAFARRVGRAHPAWVHLPADELCARLALHSGLPEDQVFRALRYDTATDPEGFLEAIRTLEFLRKKL